MGEGQVGLGLGHLYECNTSLRNHRAVFCEVGKVEGLLYRAGEGIAHPPLSLVLPRGLVGGGGWGWGLGWVCGLGVGVGGGIKAKLIAADRLL